MDFELLVRTMRRVAKHYEIRSRTERAGKAKPGFSRV
jgi:hypothetical protein